METRSFSEGGSCFVSESELTLEHARTVIELIDEDGGPVVERAIEMSWSGRARE